MKIYVTNNRKDQNSNPHAYFFNKKNKHTYNNKRDEAIDSYSSLIFKHGGIHGD